MPNQSIVRMIIGEVAERERNRRLDALAEASIKALETVEREMAAAVVTHPIPLRLSRATLESALPHASHELDLRLIKLQLRLLDQGKAKPSGSNLDFEIFREILAQHSIDIGIGP